MESLRKTSYTPIQPSIIDEDMIPSKAELSNMAPENDDESSNGVSASDTDGKHNVKKQGWPNNVVYIMLAIIIVCCIVIAVYFWMRSDETPQKPKRVPQPGKEAVGPQFNCPPGNESSQPPPPPAQPATQPAAQQLDNWEKHQENADNSKLQQYIKKPSIQHQQRDVVVNDVKLEHIPEDEPVENDGNDDDTRDKFTQELKNQIIQDVDAAIEDDTQSMISTGSAASTGSVHNECEFILTSGKNKGNVCSRKCNTGEVKCPRHVNK